MDILQNIIRVDLDQLPFLLITILIAFTVHEFSHAYFANKFGDPTARLLGRMTLNPAVHFDFFGILLLLVAGFGWARPVPVNRDNFSRPRLMGVIVSAVGPISNLLLGIIGAIIYGALAATGVLDNISNDRVLRLYIYSLAPSYNGTSFCFCSILFRCHHWMAIGLWKISPHVRSAANYSNLNNGLCSSFY